MTGDPNAASHVVRQAQLEDLEIATDLASRFYTEEGYATGRDQLRVNLRKLLEVPGAEVLVAVTRDGKAIGLAVATTTFGLEHRRIAELQDLYVLPHYRGGGVGDALVDAVVAWARACCCEALDVVIDADGDARHGLSVYYSRRGFADQRRRLLTRPINA